MTMAPGIPVWQCMTFQLYHFIELTHRHIHKVHILPAVQTLSFALSQSHEQHTSLVMFYFNYTEMLTEASTTAMSGRLL